MSRWHRGRRIAAVSLVLVIASAVLGGTVACRRGGRDEASRQARQAEQDGRRRISDETAVGVCDGTLLFARERHLGGTAGDQRWRQRGETLVTRWAPQCQQLVDQFWSSYQGCATPMAGREVETLVFWDAARIAAFTQYGVPAVAAAMTNGRSRWQQSCPADYQAVVAQEAALQAQVPLPVPLTGAPPTDTTGAPAEAQQRLFQAVSFMAHGQYQEALTELQALHASAPSPMVTFNIAVCHDQLGQTEPAVAHYQQVASDPTFGPRAQSRIAILGGESMTPSEDATRTAGEEFQRGLELAEAGSFREAIAAFNRSYGAVPHPRTILNIAVSHHRLGEVEAAISHYQLVVDDEQLEPEMRRTAMEAIQELAGSDQPAPPTATE